MTATEACWYCHGTTRVCDECYEPTCAAATACLVCNRSGRLPEGTSLRETGEPANAIGWPQGDKD